MKKLDIISRKLDWLLARLPASKQPSNWYEMGQLKFPAESPETYRMYSAFWNLWCAVDALRELSGMEREKFPYPNIKHIQPRKNEAA